MDLTLSDSVANSARQDGIQHHFFIGRKQNFKWPSMQELIARLREGSFGQNFHVRYPSVFKMQREQLVLVKGGHGSRLLQKAYRISSEGTGRTGKPLKILSPEMQKVFGNFGGKVSIQRGPPRWVDSAFVENAITFVTKLP